MDGRDNNRRAVSAPVRVRLGTPEMRGTGVSELSLIAAVNETIKLAIHASEGISLIAINANLTAGRAGSRAAGFGVVAGELRRYSERMAADMTGWANVIYGVVRETAQGRRLAHALYKLQETGRLSPKAQAALAAALERSRWALDESTQRNSVRVRELLGRIDRTEKQYTTGEMIARSALIEAAYGGSMEPVLRQVAETIRSSLARFTEFSEKVGRAMRRAVA